MTAQTASFTGRGLSQRRRVTNRVMLGLATFAAVIAVVPLI